MKRFSEGENRSQSTLFPERLDDYIAPDEGPPDYAPHVETFVTERSVEGLDGAIPGSRPANKHKRLDNYLWKSCCRGLYQLSIAA